jgi:hypothetical protein
MATDMYDDQRQEEQPKKKGMSGCLWGCLIAFVVVVVLAVLIAVIVARNWREWTASLSTQVIQQAIEATDLPEAEQTEVMEQVHRVTDAFRENQLSMEQVQRIMLQLQESPLIPSFVVSAIDEKYLNGSGLSDEEKTEARNTLNRFVQGMIQQKIAEADVNEVMAHVADRQPDGSWQLREQVTDDQLRTMLEAAKAKADAAGIDEQVEEIDPSDELRRIIDQAMTGAAAVEEPAVEAPIDAESVDVEPADETAEGL